MVPKVAAFSLIPIRPTFVPSSTVLHAAKKKVKVSSAALDALEKLEQTALLDEPLSMKELKELEKKKKQESKQQQQVAREAGLPKQATAGDEKPLSKMEKMLLLEQQAEQYEADMVETGDDEPKLSKKELKELKKKEEKELLRLEKKAAKKAERSEAQESESGLEIGSDLNGATLDDVDHQAEADTDEDDSIDDDLEYDDDDMSGEGEHDGTSKFTLEDKIRRERPPPRIRVMENAQPGYTSLRLENVGVMFRNQEVLKDVSWGVQTGDRIGLVGANGKFCVYIY